MALLKLRGRSDGHWQSCMWAGPIVLTWDSRISPLGYIYMKGVFLVQGALVTMLAKKLPAERQLYWQSRVCTSIKQPPCHGQNMPN